jgi:ABC-type multidrug transport system fused ATPase/permease subunit
MASSERLFELLDTPIEVQNPAVPKKLGERFDELEFRRVSFAYSGREWVLKDVSFRVNPGETVAIVGHTGAGKSTLINLLMRFYDIQEGQILINGHDIREVQQDELRRLMAVVQQDVFIFARTVEENIRLGSPIARERVIQAAQAVSADRFIEKRPGGYDERLEERGATLSAGERQLLAFARALVQDPPILILDEATSAVDTETELLIQRAIARLLENRTAIVIAHRLSTIQRADRIIVLHDGQVRETGTHQELLRLRGIYWRLYQLQSENHTVPMSA